MVHIRKIVIEEIAGSRELLYACRRHRSRSSGRERHRSRSRSRDRRHRDGDRSRGETSDIFLSIYNNLETRYLISLC